jgi:hypothetical protein
MGTPMVADAHSTKQKERIGTEVAEFTCSTVKDIGLAMLKWHQSCVIILGSVQWKYIFVIEVLSILTAIPDRMLQTGSEGLSKS